MASVYLGLGSNLDPVPNLRMAVAQLQERFCLTALSPVYRSAAVGFDGADFLNAVAAVETALDPLATSAEIEAIHAAVGRQRGARRNVSRRIDIDLLLYDDLVLDEPPVRVPREDVLCYGFVLRPLAEIAPDLRHPVTGRTLGEHWQDFDASQHPLSVVALDLCGSGD